MSLLLLATGPVIEWGAVGAGIMNVFIALVLTAVVKWGLPILRKSYPWLLPLISMVAPAAFAFLAEFLLGVLGFPVDFGPLLDLFLAGGAAVGVHQVYKQAKKAA